MSRFARVLRRRSERLEEPVDAPQLQDGSPILTEEPVDTPPIDDVSPLLIEVAVGEAQEQRRVDPATRALAATRAATAAAEQAEPDEVDAARAAAVAAAMAGILAAFDAFSARHQAAQAAVVREELDATAPEMPRGDRDRFVGIEVDREREFLRKARARMDADLPIALRIVDPVAREDAVTRLLDREERFVAQRDQAVAERAAGHAEYWLTRQESPAGAYWLLSDEVIEHDAECLAMGGKVWPWGVLDAFHPPVHTGCQCMLVPIDAARQAGLIRGDAFVPAGRAGEASLGLNRPASTRLRRDGLPVELPR